MTQNWKNRTIFTGDNLPVMRGMNSESVDLIYLDPPFNTGRDFPMEGNGGGFNDIWRETDINREWYGEIAETNQTLHDVITSAKDGHSSAMKAYLTFMTIRLIEIRRLLKPTGSVYLHCDPTASHYLKLLMDGIFGADNYRNEIVWGYKTGGASPRHFSKKHDSLLFYSKTDDYFFDKPKEKSYTKSAHRKEGEVNYGGGKAEFFQDEKGVYNLVGMRDVWEISYIGSTSPERTGYPTQKPLALLDRIIKASSSEGEVVFDPFCGCATTLVAADVLGRQWIGCDISEKAVEMVVERIAKARGELFATGGNLKEARAKVEEEITALKAPLVRTDAEVEVDEAPKKGDIAQREKDAQKRVLFGEQKGRCNGCGFSFPYRNLTRDHIVPQTDGGGEEIGNIQLLCAACNSAKGTGTQEELLAKLKEQKVLR